MAEATGSGPMTPADHMLAMVLTALVTRATHDVSREAMHIEMLRDALQLTESSGPEMRDLETAARMLLATWSPGRPRDIVADHSVRMALFGWSCWRAGLAQKKLMDG